MKTVSLIRFGVGHVDSVETDEPIPALLKRFVERLRDAEDDRNRDR